ncbi:hypothetical protein M436DRAFT_80821 [Aureobasidium namibiae CBS 147.97]|uniref:BTB domain-containing protein n=1 Tax=Aureobasidium namibiae CBS 147.97 TaxID=1043004 RepID=A0A074WX98_9PEZI|nr:uncharacterized protein M436DRAFT_80821 [Aureobasidium namibiae CBS 147.97]KEQ74392.1 hypothetical protein M436DRAFT_80821 [Aureobasidium namibiae CBS 147.97]
MANPTPPESVATSTASKSSTPNRNTASNAQISPKPAAGAVSNPHKVPPRACYLSTHVKIEVGSKKKIYVIHKDLLRFYSDYFRGAFSGSFKEAIEGKVSLPEEREAVFDIFTQFLYSRLLADDRDEKISWATLVDVWLFGDKYLVPSLQNSAMDSLIKKIEVDHSVPTHQIKKIWEKTLPSSPLRRYLLEHTAYRLSASSFQMFENHWTREALVELVKTFFDKEDTKKYVFPAREKCYYHIHKEGEKC